MVIKKINFSSTISENTIKTISYYKNKENTRIETISLKEVCITKLNILVINLCLDEGREVDHNFF